MSVLAIHCLLQATLSPPLAFSGWVFGLIVYDGDFIAHGRFPGGSYVVGLGPVKSSCNGGRDCKHSSRLANVSCSFSSKNALGATLERSLLPTKLTVVNFAGSRVRYDLEIVPIYGEIAGSEGIGFLVFAGKGAIVYVTFAADFAPSDENFEAGITVPYQSSFSVALGIFCASGRVKIIGLRSIG